jgi:hypothetical protein
MTTTNGHRPNSQEIRKSLMDSAILLVCECGFICTVFLGVGQSKEQAMCPDCGRKPYLSEPPIVEGQS